MPVKKSIVKESRFTEGMAKFYAYPARTVSKELPVFYNPVMALNRDFTILLLNAIPDQGMYLADPLAGTGIRSLRMLLELEKAKIASLASNDANPKFQSLVRKNLSLNKLKSKSLEISQKDANLFLLESNGFDYIDLDPFGTPNPFLDAACKRLSRQGILAVTATDTSALCGAFPDACKRKYWAKPRHDYLMHEAGIRILARKVQLVAAQYEKALEPIYCYTHEHHARIFFRSKKQKTAVDKIIDQHDWWDGAGPLWAGRLWDPVLAKSIAKAAKKHLSLYPLTLPMAELIGQESQVPVLGYFDIHEVGKRLRIGDLPKTEELIEAIKTRGHCAARTHFSGSGVRTSLPQKELDELIKKNSK